MTRPPPPHRRAEFLQTVKTMGGFREVRVLSDGSIAALGDLLYTRAIHLGCDLWGWSRRFCFSDRARADSEFAKLQTEDDTPEGWVARRPKLDSDDA
jgi:hypothetical protein